MTGHSARATSPENHDDRAFWHDALALVFDKITHVRDLDARLRLYAAHGCAREWVLNLDFGVSPRLFAEQADLERRLFAGEERSEAGALLVALWSIVDADAEGLLEALADFDTATGSNSVLELRARVATAGRDAA